MVQTEATAQSSTARKLALPQISPASSEEIVAYLRRSFQFAAISASAERDAVILDACEQLAITVPDQELQAAGDAFRIEHKLLSVADMLSWLSSQRITAEEWTEGIRIRLLEDKLKEHCFGGVVDSHYLNNRDHYRRVAISQILVRDAKEAEQIFHGIHENGASFCAMALEYSQSRPSKDQGGFMGVRFLSELLPEIAHRVAVGKENEVFGPIETPLGYHIIRLEKWFPVELDELTRKQIMESLFQSWLQKSEAV